MATPGLLPCQPTARELVGEIAKERGYLGEDQLAKIGAIEPELRRQVEEALLRKDQMIGNAVMTLARNLYTSSARFVFELLQNADDNNYSEALFRGVDPYVRFEIRHDKVSIECNEDGFTNENLKAICAIGKSSKVGAQGYIGEKGIGFKSVFMAAWKVHIQSNDFSFCFTHRQGDSGLGMVTPIWQDLEPDEKLVDGRTRITLFLHKNADAQQRETIEAQFRDIQDTILLFLRKLRRVEISFFDDDDSLTSWTAYSLHGANPATIRKTTSIDDTTVEKKYHITKHITQNVPKSENRTYSGQANRSDSAAEVILAFPLTENSVPIVEDQDVFAFLPMRPMGFKFLIHTDFVTEASRQGIVTTSLRNQSLRDGIADCFSKAVKEFCQHPTLQFQWMRWLPQKGSFPWDSYWAGLLEKINDRVQKTEALRSLDQGDLRLISDLARQQSFWLDEHGDPLFPDTDNELYIAKEYKSADLDCLTNYGLRYTYMEEYILRIEADLQQSTKYSRMKGSFTNNDWHARAANALTVLYRSAKSKKLEPFLKRFRAITAIPLDNGEWASTDGGPLYYSHCQDPDPLPIPKSLDLRLVNAEAAKNPQRRLLFDSIGVRTASVGLIRSRILSKSPPSAPDADALSISISHLKFLYQTYDSDDDDDDQPGISDGCFVYNQRMKICYPLREPVYLKTPDPYGASELLQPVAGQTPFRASFIHDSYFENAPVIPKGKTITWQQWMEDSLALRRRLELAQLGPGGKAVLSKAFQYIQDSRPENFVGALQYHWLMDDDIETEFPGFLSHLQGASVVCKNGEYWRLSETYLPLPELEGKYARYSDYDGFPFLELGEPVTAGAYGPKWGFLMDHLGVGDSDDLDFYLRALQSIANQKSSREFSDQDGARILDLYQVIHSRCQESEGRQQAEVKAKNMIEDHYLVFTPSDGVNSADWAHPEDCVWASPNKIQTRYPLENLYRTKLGRSEAGLDVLKQFFQCTLKVQDCDWHIYMDEIRDLKMEKNMDDFDWINELYVCLDQAVPTLTAVDAKALKKLFMEEQLIYVTTTNAVKWYTVDQCLWSSATQIRGRVMLNDLYPDLEEFFVNFLGVQPLTLDMVYDELIGKGVREPAPSISDVKKDIWAINALLQTSEKPPDAERILKSRIFPVCYPNGRTTLQTARTQFAVLDRKPLGDIFAAQAKFLDFTLDEVRRLKWFLKWLGLDGRYLSVVVKEISTVGGSEMTRLQHPDRDISQKAHDLLRIAVHFDSPRTNPSERDLYRTLLNAEVYETDGISSELHLSQDGRDIVHVQERSELHIREANGILEIYVPRDPKSQGFCYFSRLPREFAKWMMTEPLTQRMEKPSQVAVHVMSSVLNAPMMNVSQILEAEGIVDVDIPGELENDDASSQGSDSTPVSQHANSVPQMPRASFRGPGSSAGGTSRHASPVRNGPQAPRSSLGVHSLSRPSRTPSPLSGISATRPMFPPMGSFGGIPRVPSRSGTPSSTDLRSSFAAARSPQPSTPMFRRPSSSAGDSSTANSAILTPTPPAHPAFVFGSSPISEPVMNSFTTPVQTQDATPAELDTYDEEEYLELLDSVIVAAETMPFPSQSIFNMSGIFDTLTPDEDVEDSQGYRSSTALDKLRLGAAGELLIYELLSRLNPALSGFNTDRWQSVIRKYVTVHPEYADMTPWIRRETADFIYNDSQGTFTEHLIKRGHLNQQPWAGKTPKYMIEVKTTKGGCNTPFFLSKHQYSLMAEYSNAETSEAASAVVYMILRVYNIGKPNIGVKVYMDPEKLRKDGMLVFTEESWSVVPAAGLH
ncbi:hypothetical protein G7046_g5742 [Stylonectria norvegica]|nr:hypothetical protein G7046_g5742 [Stylonectria norvegica]